MNHLRLKIQNFIKNLLNFDNSFNNIKINSSMKIALVGNSQIIKINPNGKIIDSHDFVIRFARSPIINYENYIGTKTNLRVFNESSFESLQYNVKGLEVPSETFNMAREEINKNYLIMHTKKKEYYLKNKLKYTNKNNNLFFFDLENERTLKFKAISNYNLITKFKFYMLPKQFTSGMIVILLLKLKKIKPSLFGFSLTKTSESYDHYYSKSGKIENPVHDLKFENNLLRYFIKKKFVKYFN